jgi:pimeloyl-ACP methyl ester carboxylesterase
MRKRQPAGHLAEAGVAEPCLVIAFVHYTIRLLSSELNRHLTLTPADLAGWTTPADQLDLNLATHSSPMAGIDTVRWTAAFEQVKVLGFSFGGLIALDYALCAPARVCRVITICSPPCRTSSLMSPLSGRGRIPS